MEPIPVASIDDPRLDVFHNLTNHQLRQSLEADHGIYIAESEKVIRVALERGEKPVALLLDQSKLASYDRVLELVDPDVPVYVAPREEVSSIVGYRVHRGGLAAMERHGSPSPAEVLQGARRVAILEDITDTTNLGAIFRSAAALGVDGVLLTPHCADPLERRCVRVSMASVFLVPWARLDGWPSPSMDLLHDHGFTVAACALSPDASTLGDGSLKGLDRLALVFGTEGDGLAAGTIAACDRVVRIPMAHGVDSLNVAAASAVFFWELCDHGA